MPGAAAEHRETALWQYQVGVLLIRGLSGVHRQVRCACLAGQKKWIDGGADRIEYRLDGGGEVGGRPRGRAMVTACLKAAGFGHNILGQEKNNEQRAKKETMKKANSQRCERARWTAVT